MCTRLLKAGRGRHCPSASVHSGATGSATPSGERVAAASDAVNASSIVGIGSGAGHGFTFMTSAFRLPRLAASLNVRVWCGSFHRLPSGSLPRPPKSFWSSLLSGSQPQNHGSPRALHAAAPCHGLSRSQL